MMFFPLKKYRGLVCGVAGAVMSAAVLSSSYMRNIDLYSGVIITLAAAWAAKRALPLFFTMRWKKYAPGAASRAVLVLFSLYAAFAVVYNQIVMSSIPNDIDISALLIYALTALIWLMIEFAFFEGMERLQKHFIRQPPLVQPSASRTRERLLWFKVFCVLMTGFSFWMIACFPANMSPDSGVQWKQALGEAKLNDWHPVMHTLLIRLSVLFIESPFVMALSQTLIHAAIWATALVFLRKQGVSLVLMYGAALCIALAPNNGVMTMSILKDVPFAVSMLGLTAALAGITVKPELSRRRIFLLTAALFLMGLLRHNGFVPAALTAFALFLFYFKKWQKLQPVFAVLLIILFRIGVSRVLDISSGAGMINQPLAHALGSVFFRHGAIGKDVKQLLTEEVSEEKWIGAFHPFWSDPYVWPKLMQDPVNWPPEQPSVFSTLRRLGKKERILVYLAFLKDNPLTMIRHHLDISSINWMVFRGADPRAFTNSYVFGITTDLVDFKPRESPERSAAERILEASRALVIFDMVFWKTGLFIILLLFMGYFAWLKGNGKANIVLLPVLSNTLSLFTASSPDYRYTWQVFLLFPFIFLFFLCGNTLNKSVMER